MKTRRLLTVTFGIMVLSASVVCMTGTSSAERDGKGKQTDLSGVTQNWDKVLPAAERFVVLEGFSNEAVRDNETGLVWERTPALAANSWSGATFNCMQQPVGGRSGWRLPSFVELSSLVDPGVAPPGPTLPPGHPFLNVQPSAYWSATTRADDSTAAFTVDFKLGNVYAFSKSSIYAVWCVRGGMNADKY